MSGEWTNVMQGVFLPFLSWYIVMFRQLRNWLVSSKSKTRRRKVVSSRRPTVEPLESRHQLAVFGLIGDFGNSGPNELAVANLVKSWNPEAIVTVGDNNYNDGGADTIDANIGQYYQEYIGNYRGSYGPGSPTNRFFPSLGNHDVRTANGQPYFDYFTLPGNERYYDFVWGDVHFFALNSNSSEPDGITSSSVQAQWLQNGLANSRQRFNVVFFHHAPYTSADGIAAATNLRWPFKAWGADVVMTGHAHHYERLAVDGIPYYINGVGGDELTDVGVKVPQSIVTYSENFGAMKLTTDPSRMTIEFFSVENGGKLIDSITLTQSAPRNDAFSLAASLVGSSTNYVGANVGATIEAAETTNAGVSGGKSTWWNWTAPWSGVATVTTAGSSFDTTLGIYTGSTLATLTNVAANDDQTSSILTSSVSFNSIAGQTYRISVDGYQGAVGTIQLALTLKALPPNDAFANALPLSGAKVSASGNNTGATSEPGEPLNAGAIGGKSVWWKWTAPFSGSASIQTTGSSFDTTLGVYTGGSVSALTSVASNDDVSSTLKSSRVNFTAVTGKTYLISVDGYKGANGEISLSVDLVPPPANDNFSSAIVLTGSKTSGNGSNVGGSLQTGEPKNANTTGGRSIWWTWTAPITASVTISTTGSDFDTTLGVYTGTNVSMLTAVASSDDQSSSDKTSKVTLNAVGGRVYRISVDGYKGASGNVIVNVDQVVPPANDSFAKRTLLVGANVTALGTNRDATSETGDPRNAGVAGGRSVWWSWTAPTTGLVTISTAGSSFDTTLGVFTGSALSNLSLIADNDDEGPNLRHSRVSFQATAGVNYQILVDGYLGASGNIKLQISYFGEPEIRRTSLFQKKG